MRLNLFVRPDTDSKVSYCDGLCSIYSGLDTPAADFTLRCREATAILAIISLGICETLSFYLALNYKRQ